VSRRELEDDPGAVPQQLAVVQPQPRREERQTVFTLDTQNVSYPQREAAVRRCVCTLQHGGDGFCLGRGGRDRLQVAAQALVLEVDESERVRLRAESAPRAPQQRRGDLSEF
jgi:hypothetical protein